jgi:hypothetical protein
MAKVTIDNQEYELDSLAPEARQQLSMLQLTEQEINRLNVQLAIAQTARGAYAQALKGLLPTTVQSSGDTIAFS